MASINSFSLPPSTFPILPTPKRNKTIDPDKYSREKIEQAANAIMSGNVCSDPSHLVRFFRIMSRDPNWMESHSPTAALTLTAISQLYMGSSDEQNLVKARNKISRYVQAHHSVLAQYAKSDISLKSNNSQIPCPALFLACQSLVFDRLFRGGFKEGAELRNYYAQSQTSSGSVQFPEFIMEASSNKLAQIYIDLITKGATALTLETPDEERAFIKLVDMNDSFQAIYPYKRDVMLRHVDETNIDRIWELVLMDEAYKLFKTLPDSPRQSPKMLAEQVFIQALKQENVLTLYRFANKQRLENLGLACLKMMLSDLSLETAVQGVMTQQVILHEPVSEDTFIAHSISGEDVKAYCLNWFLEKMPEMFAKIDHKIPSKNGVKASAILHRLGGCIGLNDSDNFNEAKEFFDRFKAVAKHYEVVAHPALRDLGEEELNWVLEQLPKNLRELDLSQCKITSGNALERFTYLKKLSLRDITSFDGVGNLYDMQDLQELDLSGCTGIRILDLHCFLELQVLKLRGCNLDEMTLRGLNGCAKLQSAMICSDLKHAFERFPHIKVDLA